jgi:hypothetical protein
MQERSDAGLRIKSARRVAGSLKHRVQSGMATLMLVCRIGLFCLGICLAVGCKGPLTVDANGFIHGTGERIYRYKSGPIQLREDYEDGTLVRSRWYRPEGPLIQETKWVNGTGDGIYLREDGTIRVHQHYVNGVAEGETMDYDEKGNVTGVRQFHKGQPVESRKPTSKGTK